MEAGPRGVVRRSAGERGLTLAELVLAMLLLALLIVSVIGLFLTLMSSSARSNDLAIGTLFAENVLDRVALQAQKTYPAFDVTDPGFSGSQQFYVQDDANQTTFVYALTATELTPGTNPLPTSAGQSWLLETEVRWWSTDQARSKAGYGKLYVRQARAVYVGK